MRPLIQFHSFSTLLLLVSASAGLAGPVASFTGIGDLPGGIFDSYATSVSPDGSVVVGRGSSPGAFPFSLQPAAWTESSGIVGLGNLTGNSSGSLARGASNYGATIVGFSYSQAFRWNETLGMQGLGWLPGGGTLSYATAVSSDGSRIVGYSDSSDSSVYEAFLWTEQDGMTGLGTLSSGHVADAANDISADGTVIVGNGGCGGFVWKQNTGIADFCTFPNAPLATSMNKVSDDNAHFIGTTSNGGFIYSIADGAISLGSIDGIGASFPNGVSLNGAVVVGVSGQSFTDRAFIWDAQNGMRDLKLVLQDQYGLDLTGWSLQVANDVSADGLTIVGTGINPNGQPEGWVARLPEPASAMFLILATLCCPSARRRSVCRNNMK